MKIPRDLYYILNHGPFTTPPVCRQRSVEEILKCGIKEKSCLEITAPFCGRPENCDISFIHYAHPGTNTPESWRIKFRVYAYHKGDGRPLTGSDLKGWIGQFEDLKELEVPVGGIHLQFGWNYHTLTECDFESVVRHVKKPARLTWPTYDGTSPFGSVSPITAQKVEFLHECANKIEIVDSGRKSMEEAAAAISQVLDLDLRPIGDESSKDLWSVILGRKVRTRPDNPCSPGPNIPKSYIYVSQVNNYSAPHTKYSFRSSNAEDDFFVVKFKALAAHNGDRQPLWDDKFLELQRKGEETELMEVPLGGMHKIGSARGSFDILSHDDFEKPIEKTWRDSEKLCLQKKYDFLRNYMRMIYILDSGERSEEEAEAALRGVLSPINLRHSTDSQGRDYWYRSVRTCSPKSSGPRLSKRSSGSSRITLLDLYGNNEEVHTHWCNTH